MAPTKERQKIKASILVGTTLVLASVSLVVWWFIAPREYHGNVYFQNALRPGSMAVLSIGGVIRILQDIKRLKMISNSSEGHSSSDS